MASRVVLVTFLATLKISLGTKNAENFGEATEEGNSEPRGKQFDSQLDSENRDRTKNGLTDHKCIDARDCLKDVLKKDPIKLLKFNEIFALKSQGRLLDKDFIKNGTHPGQISTQPRLAQLYKKALRGEDINVAVIGGSNAAGGSLYRDEKSLQGIFYNVFGKWWNTTIASWTGSYVKIHSVGIRGLGSYLFAFCYDNFLPPGVTIDLVMVEQSVNFQAAEKSAPLEILTRQIIRRSPSSVIFFVNLLSSLGTNPRTQKSGNPNCTNLENYGQINVASRYMITSFSIKDLVCKKITGGSYVIREDITRISRVIASDSVHVGALAHAQIGLMMINYFREVFVKISETKLTDFDDGDRKIASSLLPTPVYKVSHTEDVNNPQCWLTLTPDACRKNVQHPTLTIHIEKNKGFRFYDAFIQEPPLNCNGKSRKDLQRGWGGWGSDKFIRFLIFVHPWNSGSAEQSRSVVIVLRGQFNGGEALVWLDKEKEAAVGVDNRSRLGNHLFIVARRVSPGIHTIDVQTTSEGFFIISGILVGPPDFNKNGVV